MTDKVKEDYSALTKGILKSSVYNGQNGEIKLTLCSVLTVDKLLVMSRAQEGEGECC